MKNILLLLFLSFLFAEDINAQSCKTAGTTLEEYNYVVKGYKVQIESGLDMKKGYSLVDIRKVEFGGRRAIFKELIKNGKDLRAIMVIFTGKNGLTSYYCIPLGEVSDELLNAYYDSVYATIDNSEAMNFYQYSISRVLNTYLIK